MADLLDIAPSCAVEAVHISGDQRVKVRGVQVNEIAAIAARFPNLVAVFAGAGDNIVALCSSIGLGTGAIIAAGCGHPGDEKAEAIANKLLPEDQLRLLTSIYRLTFPNGLGPVMEAMAGLVTGAAEMPKPVKVRLKKSPSPSPLLSEAVSHPIMQ